MHNIRKGKFQTLVIYRWHEFPFSDPRSDEYGVEGRGLVHYGELDYLLIVSYYY